MSAFGRSGDAINNQSSDIKEGSLAKKVSNEENVDDPLAHPIKNDSLRKNNNLSSQQHHETNKLEIRFMEINVENQISGEGKVLDCNGQEEKNPNQFLRELEQEKFKRSQLKKKYKLWKQRAEDLSKQNSLLVEENQRLLAQLLNIQPSNEIKIKPTLSFEETKINQEDLLQQLIDTKQALKNSCLENADIRSKLNYLEQINQKLREDAYEKIITVEHKSDIQNSQSSIISAVSSVFQSSKVKKLEHEVQDKNNEIEKLKQLIEELNEKNAALLKEKTEQADELAGKLADSFVKYSSLERQMSTRLE